MRELPTDYGDYDLMKVAVEEARKSKQEPGRVPLYVGAVVLVNGMFEKAHRGELGSGDHAEFTLLERKLKDERLAGATVFTTLEPCTKRGPRKVPCAHRLIERRVSRVVIGTLDPNPIIDHSGVQKLRAAGVAVEFFPTDLMAELEELNREFYRSHNSAATQTSPDQEVSPQKAQGQPVSTSPHQNVSPDEFVQTAVTRSLDEWYIALNSIYFHRNFNRTPSDICLHLYEVMGGVSLLASRKSKPGVNPEAHVYKAVAWWFALCGKMNIASVETMLWDKFPRVCPYCHKAPHIQEECAEKKRGNRGPAWDVLSTIGQSGRRPVTLGDWQRMFNDIYPVNQGDEFGSAVARLYEELAELAEAVRVFTSAPGYFLTEAADVFAWLMKVQNIIDERADRRKNLRGLALEEGFASAYPDICVACGNRLCTCPQILPSTIGRIAHEVPEGRGPSEPSGRFMAQDKATALFFAASQPRVAQ